MPVTRCIQQHFVWLPALVRYDRASAQWSKACSITVFGDNRTSCSALVLPYRQRCGQIDYIARRHIAGHDVRSHWQSRNRQNDCRCRYIRSPAAPNCFLIPVDTASVGCVGVSEAFSVPVCIRDATTSSEQPLTNSYKRLLSGKRHQAREWRFWPRGAQLLQSPKSFSKASAAIADWIVRRLQGPPARNRSPAVN